jgi:hypothetical protein
MELERGLVKGLPTPYRPICSGWGPVIFYGEGGGGGGGVGTEEKRVGKQSFGRVKSWVNEQQNNSKVAKVG